MNYQKTKQTKEEKRKYVEILGLLIKIHQNSPKNRIQMEKSVKERVISVISNSRLLPILIPVPSDYSIEGLLYCERKKEKRNDDF